MISQNTPFFSLTVLGSGPAGLTAALYAARAGISVQLFCGPDAGGQLTTTTLVENWPGGAENLTGPELMLQMEQQLQRYPVAIHYEQIEDVDLTTSPFKLWTKNKIYQTDALIIATGARARYLGLSSEANYFNKGVSACATCDGFFYRGKPVAVVGGGSSAVEESLYLSDLASHVHLIHRRDAFRAEHMLMSRLKEKCARGKITIHTPYTVKNVLGDGEKVTGIEIESLNHLTKKLCVDALFVAIGRAPCSEWLRGKIDLDEEGFILTQRALNLETATSVAGVFAAGDVVKGAYRQAITAASSGCMAALDAKNFLDSKK